MDSCSNQGFNTKSSEGHEHCTKPAMTKCKINVDYRRIHDIEIVYNMADLGKNKLVIVQNCCCLGS